MATLPRIKQTHFSPTLDHFSAWLICLSLYALSVKPDLWSLLNGGDDCLIFRRADLANPATSQAFNFLYRESDPTLLQLTRQVQAFLVESPLGVPPLDLALPKPGKKSLVLPTQKGVAQSMPSGTSLGIGSVPNSNWYHQHQVQPSAPPSSSAPPLPSLPPIPAPNLKPQSVGASAWVPGLQVRPAAPTPRTFAPIPVWHRILLLIAFPTLVVLVTSLAVFPVISPVALALLVCTLVISIVRYKRDPVARERREARDRLISAKRQMNTTSHQIGKLGREREQMAAKYQRVVDVLATARPESEKVAFQAPRAAHLHIPATVPDRTGNDLWRRRGDPELSIRKRKHEGFALVISAL